MAGSDADKVKPGRVARVLVRWIVVRLWPPDWQSPGIRGARHCARLPFQRPRCKTSIGLSTHHRIEPRSRLRLSPSIPSRRCTGCQFSGFRGDALDNAASSSRVPPHYHQCHQKEQAQQQQAENLGGQLAGIVAAHGCTWAVCGAPSPAFWCAVMSSAPASLHFR